MNKESFCIIKEMVVKGNKLNVILLNDETTIMEYDTYEKAIEVSRLFELNSDKGWKYKVRKIGK
jgi:hypothetical protein